MRPLFPAVLSYNGAHDEGRRRRGGGICGQCVCAECPDGLSAAALHRAPGGGDSAPAALRSGGSPGRGLCRGGIPAGVRFSEPSPGEAGGRGPSFRDRLWRRGAAAAADAAAVRRVLRHGRVRAGTGIAGGQRRAGGPGCLLHRCVRKSAADRRSRGLSGSDGGVPGGGPPRSGRPAGPGAGVPRGPQCRTDGPVGHRKRPAGPGDRRGGTGGISRGDGRCFAVPGAAIADTGAAAVPTGPAGAAAADGSGPSVAAGALPGGGRAGGIAAGGAQRLDGDRRGAVSGTDSGVFPHGPGAGICRSLGRTGQKERQAWKNGRR